jgi:hypothetical protein
VTTVAEHAFSSGSGVTFYLTGPGAGFTVDAQGSFDLAAPVDGPYGGILFYQNRLSNAGTLNTFVGGSSTKIMGSIYMPTQKVRVAGGSSLTQEVPFFPIIADQIEITGNIKAKAELASVTLPYPLPKSESGARLVD